MGSERGLLFLLAAGFLINTTGGSLSKHASNQQQIIQTRNYDYEPTWESLDARPLPNWYDQGKIGIFVHWGVYSVPAFSSEWFWYHWLNGNNPAIAEFMERNYRPGFSYQDFGVQFTAEFYNATRWAQLFKKAGASYVVLTSKHHEGYALWPSKYSFSWNSVDVGSHRNLLGELAEAVRSETDLRFGLYHSLFEWYNPLFLEDEKTNYTSDVYVRFKSLPAMYELVNEYQPDIFWSDGEWGGPDGYWQSKEFLAWLYNDSPVRDIVVTNDRWGAGTICHHGGFYTCADRYNPGVLQPHKWENVFTIDKKSWGHRKDAPIEEHLTADEMIQTIVETVACGGNAMINVGPTKEGTIVPIQEERLLQLGKWLGINGEGIYTTVPWLFQNDTLTPGVWYTSRPTENFVYAIALDWPADSELHLAVVDSTQVSSITLLGSGPQELIWEAEGPGIKVLFPNPLDNKSKWAWTFRIQTTQQ